MSQMKIRCVKVAGLPDTEKILQKAFDCLTEEDLSPVWFTEEECMKIEEKEKGCSYVFSSFEGAAFEHISKLGSRILGPQCVLTCKACKKEIPRKHAPIYNLAMKDVVVCCTNIDKDHREKMYQYVQWMDGIVSKNLTEDVTHLIAGEVGSKKYKVAAGMGIQIMVPQWIEVVWKTSMLESAVHGLDEQFQQHKCPVFKGLVVTVSSLSAEERKEVKKLIEKEGGRYTGEMKMKECTHLIINEPKGQKYEFAIKWMIHVVTTEWLYESIEKGFCQDEENFKVKRPTSVDSSKPKMQTSTPERKSLLGSGIADLSNISAISMMAVNETAVNNVTNMDNTTRSTDGLDSLENLDLTQAPTDFFLDGCKVYLSGFRGPSLDKLRKIINAGGGTRFSQIKESLTHVIVGEKINREIDEIKALTARPHVVTAQWLIQCFKENRLVREADFSCVELPPLDPMSPKLKSKKLPSRQPKTQTARTPKSTPTENDDKEEEEDMDDIMSQYMTGVNVDTNTTATTENRKEESKDVDDDLTQEPAQDQTTVLPDDDLIFSQKTFVFYGFEEGHIPILSSLIMENGGRVLQQNARGVPDYAVVPLDGFPVDRTVNDIVTNIWVQMSIEQKQLLDIDSNVLFRQIEIKVGGSPLDHCVLSFSGFAGTERDILIHIAELLGAKCQEYFTKKATTELERNTHLIVKAAEGSKYVAAKKWGIPALSKEWLIDCACVGKKQLEDRYHIDQQTLEQNKDTSTESETANKMEVDTDTPVKQNVQIVSEKNSAQVKTEDVSFTKKSAVDNSRMSVSVNKSVGDFSHEGDTDALMLEIESQPKEIEQSKQNCDKDISMDTSKDSVIILAPNNAQSVETDFANEGETAKDCKQNIVNNEQTKTPLTPRVESLAERSRIGSNVVTPVTNLSQKENLTTVKIATPLQNRVRELQQSEGIKKVCDKDTPSKFLNPNKRYHPNFDVQELLAELETPEEIRRKKRRSSLPLDELFDLKLEEALQTTMKIKGRQPSASQMLGDEVDGDDDMPSHVLEGVVICVSKKLGTSQSELNNIVSSLGGDYRWNYDSTCTHFIFQGRQNDKTKEYKVALAQKKKIVCPHWLYMCKEQNAWVDEELFPHTYRPDHSLTGLSVSKRGTPARTPARSTRRAMRERVDKEETISVIKEDNSSVGGGKSSDVEMVAVSTEDDKADAPVVDEGGGSLEMREALSRQLENIMAESKIKKRRRSGKRMNSSGLVNTPDDPSSDMDNDASRQSLRQNRRTQEEKVKSSPTVTAQIKEVECNSAEMAPSQSIQVVWDDPLGRMEQEKLAHKLERACSPTQDAASLGLDIPEGAQFSDTEGEPDITVPSFTKTTEPGKARETTPQQVKKISQRTPTPEGPSLAFPLPKQNKNPTPPRPVELIGDDKQEEEKTPPVFMISGMSPEERDDYGALVEQLGGALLDTQSFDPRCTHLIIKNIARSEKFLASVASGKWVLHVSYLEECRKEGRFVEEEIHEWGGENSALRDKLEPHIAKLAEASRLWRIKIQEEKRNKQQQFGAFCTWKVILCCSKNRESNYQRLLEAGGATVLPIRPPFTKTVSATHVLMELSKVSLAQEDLEMLVSSGCLCLRADFISAHLADPSPKIEEFCPPEVLEIKASMTGNMDAGKKRKASGNTSSIKRSRRR